jgi:hypothetical protein
MITTTTISMLIIPVEDLLKLPKSLIIPGTRGSSDQILSLDFLFLEIYPPETSLRQCRAICHGLLLNYYRVNRTHHE